MKYGDYPSILYTFSTNHANKVVLASLHLISNKIKGIIEKFTTQGQYKVVEYLPLPTTRYRDGAIAMELYPADTAQVFAFNASPVTCGLLA